MSLRARKKAQVRQTILAAAGALIEAEGYERATMRTIAAAADVSYQTLYNYFPTKALILQGLLAEDVAEVAGRVQALVDGYQGHLLETLQAINRAQLDAVAHRDRDLWRVAVLGLLQQDDGARHLYQLIDTTAPEALGRLIGRAQERGELDQYMDPRTLADALFAQMDHAFLLYLLDTHRSRTELLKSLQDQTRLLVIPYLRAYPPG